MTVQASPRRLGAQLKARLATARAAQLRKRMYEVAAVMGSRLPPHMQLLEASRQAQLAKAADTSTGATSIGDPYTVSGYVTVASAGSKTVSIPQAALAAEVPALERAGKLTVGDRSHPVGKIVSAKADSTGLFVTAQVTDAPTWASVKAGFYKGLSSVGSIAHAGGVASKLTIHSIALTEVSSPGFSAATD